MVQVFRVPEMTSAGLKNKGKTTADMNERRTAAAEYTKTSLENIGAISFDALAAEKNVEKHDRRHPSPVRLCRAVPHQG